MENARRQEELSLKQINNLIVLGFVVIQLVGLVVYAEQNNLYGVIASTTMIIITMVIMKPRGRTKYAINDREQ